MSTRISRKFSPLDLRNTNCILGSLDGLTSSCNPTRAEWKESVEKGEEEKKTMSEFD